jgi:protein-S-isoprenylcysteine O-methyltransferase Ste14
MTPFATTHPAAGTLLDVTAIGLRRVGGLHPVASARYTARLKASTGAAPVLSLAVLSTIGLSVRIRLEERALLAALGESYRAYAEHRRRLRLDRRRSWGNVWETLPRGTR